MVFDKKLYRYSFVINYPPDKKGAKGIPVHRKYYGIIGQIWVSVKSAKLRKLLEKKVKEALKKWLGFEEEEYWFNVIEGEGWQEVEYDKDLENYWEIRIEDENGETIEKTSGKYEKAEYD
jgi:hypothetical protein